MKILTKLKQNFNKMVENSKERDKGKVLYKAGKELTEEHSDLIKEGFYKAQRREQEKAEELEKIKLETQKIKLIQAKDKAKLESLKLKTKISEERKKSQSEFGGW